MVFKMEDHIRVKKVESKVVSKSEPEIKDLERKLIETKEAAFSETDPILHRSYILACASVANIPLTYESLTTLLTNPTDKEKEFMGITAYVLGDFDRAIKHLEQAKVLAKRGVLLYSTLSYNKRKSISKDQIESLRTYLPDSGPANTIMAVLHFNRGKAQKNYSEFVLARKYLQKSINLGETETKLVDLLTAVYASGKELEANASARDLITKGSIKLTMGQVKERFQRNHLDMPLPSFKEKFYELAKEYI
jgi:tetratricopeptide (TPR) repeat protein